MLDYQRASLQQKLLVAVSRIEPRSIGEQVVAGKLYAPRPEIPIISTTANSRRRLGTPNRQLRNGSGAT